METQITDETPVEPPSQGLLFEVPEDAAAEGHPPPPEGSGNARLRRANRRQVRFYPMALDELLSEDHEARVVWNYVEGLDLNPLLARIAAVEGRAGRSPADPKILLALWLYAALRAVGSARELNRLCEYHAAYRWICGGVSMNYHTLSDFRTDHLAFLDELLSQGVAVLMQQDLVKVDRVAHDGMRVRASAGAASFRRRPTLEECLHVAEEQIQHLRAELEADPAAASKRQQAARERAARERAQRVQQALAQLPEIEAKKKSAEKKKARCSTTDPEARVMKMADGGYRPAYNVQLATDTKTQVIVGVDVTNSGGDRGQMAPMVEQIESRHGQPPAEMLVDGGFVKKEDIDEVSPPAGGTVVYAPVMKSKDPQRDEHTPRADDSPAVAEWRVRMGTEEAKQIYKERAATAECVNGIARNRGLQQFRVRGLVKVRAVALWYALAHNMMRAAALRAQAAALRAEVAAKDP
jgi:transposase